MREESDKRTGKSNARKDPKRDGGQKDMKRKLGFKSWKDFFKTFGISLEGKRDISLGKGKEARCAVSPDMRRMVSSISKEPEYAGSLLGRESKGRFKPSLWSIEKASANSNRKVKLDKRTAWLFLCGRDIFMSSLKGDEPEKGYVFPMNEHDENLGIGYFDGKMLHNLADKGDFLRREG